MPEFGASGDFLYPRALRHFLSDISSVSRFLMYKRFPGHFSDLNMPYCVHSWCTVFLDVDVFLALLRSYFASLPSQSLRWPRLGFFVRFAHNPL